MFTPALIRERLNQRPFKPFRIHMSDGPRYDVTNHDEAFVKRHAVEIGGNPDADFVSSRFVECAFIHISRIEEIEAHKAA